MEYSPKIYSWFLSAHLLFKLECTYNLMENKKIKTLSKIYKCFTSLFVDMIFFVFYEYLVSGSFWEIKNMYDNFEICKNIWVFNLNKKHTIEITIGCFSMIRFFIKFLHISFNIQQTIWFFFLTFILLMIIIHTFNAYHSTFNTNSFSSFKYSTFIFSMLVF